MKIKLYRVATSEKGILAEEEELSIRTFYTLPFLRFIKKKRKEKKKEKIKMNEV